MTNFSKPPLSFKSQVELLENRKLIVSDREKAQHILASIGYYRLSGYLYPFKIPGSEDFIEGTKFENVIEIYFFDSELRALIFEAIENFEIALRTQMIYHLSFECGPTWYLDSNNFVNHRFWEDHVNEISQNIERSKEKFIQGFYDNYSDDYPPAWIAFQILSLRTLEKIFENLRLHLDSKTKIAQHFGHNTTAVFQTWMRATTEVRNICAHHARLWNRNLPASPGRLERQAFPWINSIGVNQKKFYYFSALLAYMLRAFDPDTVFVSKLLALLEKYPNISLDAMGFPAKWQDDSFWNV